MSTVGLEPFRQPVAIVHRYPTAPVCYWEVEDIASSFQSLLDAGAESHGAINDGGGGKLVATVRDGDGNITGLVQSP
ncbi:MAG: hypothetical protein JJE05_09995 [Actinobacteria bacterium]|nr:hypothetical protein [Actinomycetota bacterium]